MSQQTSKKTGVASSSEKQANSRHSTQPMPATQPKPGTFDKEPPENPEERSANRNRRPETLTQIASAKNLEKKTLNCFFSVNVNHQPRRIHVKRSDQKH